MKMSCEKFCNWLNEGNSVDEVHLPDEIRAHLQLCTKCQQTLESHVQLIQRIDHRLKLSSASRLKIYSKLEARIDSNANQGSTWPERIARFFSIGSNKMSLFAAGITVVLLTFTSVFLFHHADETGAKNAILVSGSGLVQTEDRRIVLTGDGFKFYAPEKLRIESEAAQFFWNNSTQLVISGNAEFIIDQSKAKMLDGQASIHFEPTVCGYLVEMGQIIIHITGTRLRLSTCREFDHITVERGRISWQLKDSEITGVALEGMSIKVVGGKVETSRKPEEPAPLEKFQEQKPFVIPSEPEVPAKIKRDRSD
jgi:hypothetical protein